MHQLLTGQNRVPSVTTYQHDSIDHIVVGFAECLDSFVSSTARMLHYHIDVVWREASLALSGTVILRGGRTGWLGTAGGGSVGAGHGGLSLGSSHLLGFSGLEALVGVIELEFSERDELGAVRAVTDDLRVVNYENGAIALLDGNTSDSSEWLHAELGEGLAALSLASVELGTVLAFEGGHLFLLLDFLRLGFFGGHIYE